MEFNDMNINSDYLNMLKILDYCYNLNKSNNDLGALLGVFSLDIWEDNRPADIADYNIWIECSTLITDSDIICKIISFLERLIDEFEFELQPTILLLKNLTRDEVYKLIYDERDSGSLSS